MGWHVIVCWEKAEKKLALKLAAAGLEVWRPVVLVRVMRRWRGTPLASGQRVKQYAPVYPSYLFVRVNLTESLRASIREQDGFKDWLCYAGSREPVALPDSQISAHQNDDFKVVVSEHECAKGDTVKILVGPFATFHGVVEEVDKKRDRIKVAASIFGRPTPIEIPVGHVELVEHGERPPIEQDVTKRPRKRA